MKDDKGQIVKDYTKTKLKTEEIKSFDIDNKSNKEIFDLIASLGTSYDTPYYYKDGIIIGYGDNVDEDIDALRRSLDVEGKWIQTWS